MSNKKGFSRILEFRESQERPPKWKTLSAYFGDENSGNLQDLQPTSLVHIEEGDSSQVGEYFEEVQVGEPDILVDNKLEDDFEVVPLSRESQNDIIDLGEKRSDAKNDIIDLGEKT